MLHRPRPALVLLAAATAALAACSSSAGAEEAAPTERPRVTADAGAGAEATPRFTAQPPVSVLSGEVGVVDGPALAVKVDNTRPAFPQVGLQAADVVYVEEVEGGLTRLMAVYASELPAEVGPVRSARLSDIEILGAYGPVALAYSGSNGGTDQLIRSSPLKPLSMDRGASGYRRDRSRRAPYNVMGDPRALLADVPGAPAPQDVGFRFGEAPAGGRPAGGVSTGWSGARIDFAWAPEEGRYLQSMDGRPSSAAEGGRLGAHTVVVQQVAVEASPFRDVSGNPTPHVRTIGSGSAVVLRDGQAWDLTWSRPDVGSPTTYALPDGTPMPFKPGQTWVVLVPVGTAVAVR